MCPASATEIVGLSSRILDSEGDVWYSLSDTRARIRAYEIE